jgi:hypothetical protein
MPSGSETVRAAMSNREQTSREELFDWKLLRRSTVRLTLDILSTRSTLEIRDTDGCLVIGVFARSEWNLTIAGSLELLPFPISTKAGTIVEREFRPKSSCTHAPRKNTWPLNRFDSPVKLNRTATTGTDCCKRKSI